MFKTFKPKALKQAGATIFIVVKTSHLLFLSFFLKIEISYSLKIKK